MLKTYPCGFDSTKVKHFIQNFALSREREILSGYLDIYNSNSQKRLSMHEALQRLKRDVSDRNTLHIGSTSCAKLYEIKRLAITQYLFYYNSHIQAIIDATEDFHRKVILLRLFYQQIIGDTIQQKYKCILSDNFAQLPISAIYDFSFSGWLTPDQNSIKELLNEILEISRKEVAGVHSYPDPVETKLECVYLLHINDMIADISALKELSEERPHLQCESRFKSKRRG